MSLEKQQFIESKFLSVFNDKSFKEILSKEDYNKYIEAKKTVFFNKGEALFEEGSNVDGIYFIENGTAKLYKLGFNRKEQILRFIKVDSQLSYTMLQKISFELGESSNTVTFLAQKTVRERLAEVLLLLEQKLGTDPEGFIKISLTREEIANLIGTATESAIRLISEFKQDDYIAVEGRNIKILNHEKLKKLGHVVL